MTIGDSALPLVSSSRLSSRYSSSGTETLQRINISGIYVLEYVLRYVLGTFPEGAESHGIRNFDPE